jgi:hypothetical protein
MPAHQFETQITFLTDDPENELDPHSALVIDRGEEMVLEIPVQSASEQAYTVRGRKTLGYYYAGQNERKDPPTPVIARWALLGDVYVGFWRENSVEWLISFNSPRPVAATRPSTLSPSKVRQRR